MCLSCTLRSIAVSTLSTVAGPESGIRPSERSRRVGEYIIGDLLWQGPGFQDREAKHARLEGTYRRVRTYLVAQVTDGFVRAGEGYFSPDGKKIIFQAEEKDTGNPFYQIFVMDLATGKLTRVSPGMGRTTCGYST